MNKTIFQAFSIFALTVIFTTTLFSCHPDSPRDFIDYDENPGKYEKPDADSGEYTYTNSWSYPTKEPKQLWSGSGTETNPYIIKTAQQLANLSYMVNNGKRYSKEYFRLDSDIDLNSGLYVTSSSSSAKQWTPIGGNGNRFQGNFDGNNYTINGLYINSNEYEYAGLFGYIENGTIENLILKNGFVSNAYSSYPRSGAIAGQLYSSQMISCGNDATEVASSVNNAKVGGLVGYSYSSKIYNSYCRSTVSGYTHSSQGNAGGIAGNATNGTIIKNCYFSGFLSAYTTNAIANKSDSYYQTSNVSFCYYYKNCKATANDWGNGQTEFSSASSIIYTMPDDNGDTLLNRLNMWVKAQQSASTYCTWTTDSSNGYPTLSNSYGASKEYAWSYPTSSQFTVTWSGSGTQYDPITIKTAQELADFAYLVNSGTDYKDKYIELANDITLNPKTMYINTWTPIGNSSSNKFKGNFNGNNHTINGLYINSDDRYQKGGLFGYIEDGSVRNLTIGYGDIYNSDDSFYSNSVCIGSLAGYIEDTTIVSCKNTGTKVHAERGYCGGLVGEMDDSEISSSTNFASVNSTNGYAGGIVGVSSGDSVVYSFCHNYGTVWGEVIY